MLIGAIARYRRICRSIVPQLTSVTSILTRITGNAMIVAGFADRVVVSGSGNLARALSKLPMVADLGSW